MCALRAHNSKLIFTWAGVRAHHHTKQRYFTFYKNKRKSQNAFKRSARVKEKHKKKKSR